MKGRAKNKDIKILQKKLEKTIEYLSKTKRDLRESEQKLESMLRSIPDHISMIDKELNIVWANESALRMFGDNIIGKKCYRVYHRREKPCEPQPCLAVKAFEDGKIHEHDTEVIGKDGKKIYFHCTANVALKDEKGNPIMVLEISRDITESREAQEQVIRSEKLAVVGRLAANVAHEINNPLVGLLNLSQLAIRKTSKDDPNRKYLELIEKAAFDCQRFTKNLLSFSRPHRLEVGPVDINSIIEKTLAPVEQKLARQKIRVVKRYAAGLPAILADSGQLEQVFLNIILNACQAMQDGGKLEIYTKKKGEFFEISFGDTGCGIPKRDISKIFDPFFTTFNEGTGLGLAIVSSIVGRHKGSIKVKSAEGKGTTFIIELPIGKQKGI